MATVPVAASYCRLCCHIAALASCCRRWPARPVGAAAAVCKLWNVWPCIQQCSVVWSCITRLFPTHSQAEFLELLEHDKRKPKHTGFFISKVGRQSHC